MAYELAGVRVWRDVREGAFVLRGVQRWYLNAAWPPCGVVWCGVVLGACTSLSLSVCCVVCFGGWAVCSVWGNDFGGVGAAAIADGLKHVPSLTRLKYVCVDDRVWVCEASWVWYGLVCACALHHGTQW
jgi:hypothetical protein